MPPLLDIEVPTRLDRVPVGETVQLRFTVACPDGLGVVIPQVGHEHPDRVRIDTDGLPNEIRLRGGEAYSFSLDVQFQKTGPADLCDFFLQANPTSGRASELGELLNLPAHAFEVVPSLTNGLAISITRIYTYESAAKVEVSIRHTGVTDWHDLSIDVLRPDQVRSGITRHRRTLFRPDESFAFDLVLEGDVCELSIATVSGDLRVQQCRTLAIPTAHDLNALSKPFRFLEPRNLTVDYVSIVTEQDPKPVVSRNGIYPLHGAKSRYLLTIRPSNLLAKDVKVYPAPGEVEVEFRKLAGHEWSFHMTVVDNPAFTQAVRLDYDVHVPGETLRGELYFSIRPGNGKLWAVAATAGAAVTVRGLAGMGANVFQQDHFVETLLTDGLELFRRNWTDSLQLVSIFVIRFGLSLVDRLFCRPFQEG